MGFDNVTLKLVINQRYDCVYQEEKISSMISSEDELDYSGDAIDMFKYKDDVDWWIENYRIKPGTSRRVLHFSLDLNKANIDKINGLMDCLYRAGIIYTIN